MPKYLVTARYEIEDKFVVEADDEEAAVAVADEAWNSLDAEFRGHHGAFEVDAVVAAAGVAKPDYVQEPA